MDFIWKLWNFYLMFVFGCHAQEFDSMKCARERGRINSNEFVTMFQEMATRPEIYFLLIRFANRDYFTAEDFQNFLECEQSVSFPSHLFFF